MPEETLLYVVVAEQLETFLARQQARERPVPRFVEREFRDYLTCGLAANGFLRLHCDTCGHDRTLPFSCKHRGWCPSCGGRRMADTAAHLVDRVLQIYTPIVLLTALGATIFWLFFPWLTGSSPDPRHE